MSVKAISHVFRTSRAKGTARVIMLAIADHADDATMTAWPSLTTLARMANVDRRWVIRAVQALVDDGELQAVGKGARGVVKYRITSGEMTTRGEAVTSGDIATSGQTATGGEMTTSTSGEMTTVSSGEMTTRTIIEPSIEPSESPLRGPPANFDGSSDHEAERRQLTLVSPEPNPTKPDPGERFEAFWQAYPRRGGANPKKPAREKFERLVKGGADPQAIIDGAAAYAAECEAQGKTGTEFVAQAVTWLNQRRFEDAPLEIPEFLRRTRDGGPASRQGAGGGSVAAAVRRLGAETDLG